MNTKKKGLNYSEQSNICRNRGITMDVGITSFETQHRKVTLLDAPGHRDFVPNMISGAAQADVALLVIDAIAFESGFENDGQTKEHALLAKSLGVQQLGVVINKLDSVDWSEERYNTISTKLGQFLKQSGYKDSAVWFLPASGLSGENLVKKEEPKLSWFKGSTLAQKIGKQKVTIARLISTR
jgi:elongation factor 1 alpha-like protein